MMKDLRSRKSDLPSPFFVESWVFSACITCIDACEKSAAKAQVPASDLEAAHLATSLAHLYYLARMSLAKLGEYLKIYSTISGLKGIIHWDALRPEGATANDGESKSGEEKLDPSLLNITSKSLLTALQVSNEQ